MHFAINFRAYEFMNFSVLEFITPYLLINTQKQYHTYVHGYGWL